MTTTMTIQMYQITCSCGGVYALPERYVGDKREGGGYWRCPYCTGSCGFNPEGSPLYRAQKEAAEKVALLARERAAHDQTKASLRSANAITVKEKNKAVRLKKRLANGVCPCCHRTFSQLSRHMTSKHPEYQASANEAKPQ